MLISKRIKANRDVFLILVPLLIWGILFLCRPYLYSAWCAKTPSPCLTLSVNALDQVAFQYRSITADFYSNVVQNSIGVLAFLLPWMLFLFGGKGSNRNRRAELSNPAFKLALFETKLLLLATLWNAAILEITRLLIQRPRPLVYDLPLVEGLNVHQYTSFYSGHTSFVALATLSLFFMVRRRYSRRHTDQDINHLRDTNQLSLHLAALAFFIFWTAVTGVLRVWGGRHYPTDVIAAALIGVVITWTVQTKLQSNPQ